MGKPVILMSACLMGVNCRYDGGGKRVPELEELMELAQIVPVCPEILGGLPTPRTPSERVGNRVVMKDGTDVTGAFQRGAGEALKLARLYGAELAILKERSPSCGSGMIYDGSFSGKFAPGDGVTGEMMKKNGIAVYGESRIQELMEKIRRGEDR
ncbi:MAG: DUF523 domain-containing protein [Clostridia bacterium]|nr:DUF523 domain-containing protein [Clostridia bacterium]